MKKEYIVIKAYENSNTDPIVLNKGDVVQLGEKSKTDGPWPNWVYCISNRSGKAGWTPIQVLQIGKETGVAITEYTAKEMTVDIGDVLYGDKELNGWLWCLRKTDREEGWVPKDCLNHIK